MFGFIFLCFHDKIESSYRFGKFVDYIIKKFEFSTKMAYENRKIGNGDPAQILEFLL